MDDFGSGGGYRCRSVVEAHTESTGVSVDPVDRKVPTGHDHVYPGTVIYRPHGRDDSCRGTRPRGDRDPADPNSVRGPGDRDVTIWRHVDSSGEGSRSDWSRTWSGENDTFAPSYQNGT